VFFTGVFSLFACVGFLNLLLEPRYVAPWRLIVTVGVMGGLAVVCAAAGVVRKFWVIGVVAAVEAVFFSLLEMFAQAPVLASPNSAVRNQVVILTVGALVSVIAGYVFFITFLSQQGARFFRAQTEIQLASEIHRALVPKIHQTLGCYELFGVSVPSGEVGGDLVDVTGDANSWTAYVADVSGHGVSAGLLMAMFKTAVRTRASDASPEVMLQEVHRALYPLKTNNMFVTAGFIGYTGGQLTLSLAGHPALLRYSKRSGTVEEHPTLDLPLGILPEQSFSAQPLACDSGDVLLLLTDGLTEVFDKNGNEMGIAPIKAELARSASLPLSDLFTQLRQGALAAGHQDDDQTMLLVRKHYGILGRAPLIPAARLRAFGTALTP
jgi:serine phosphatase RsbU (regulator of sigma subunit)